MVSSRMYIQTFDSLRTQIKLILQSCTFSQLTCLHKIFSFKEQVLVTPSFVQYLLPTSGSSSKTKSKPNTQKTVSYPERGKIVRYVWGYLQESPPKPGMYHGESCLHRDPPLFLTEYLCGKAIFSSIAYVSKRANKYATICENLAESEI